MLSWAQTSFITPRLVKVSNNIMVRMFASMRVYATCGTILPDFVLAEHGRQPEAVLRFGVRTLSGWREQQRQSIHSPRCGSYRYTFSLSYVNVCTVLHADLCGVS
jgi:hypothetical protein